MQNSKLKIQNCERTIKIYKILTFKFLILSSERSEASA